MGVDSRAPCSGRQLVVGLAISGRCVFVARRARNVLIRGCFVRARLRWERWHTLKLSRSFGGVESSYDLPAGARVQVRQTPTS